MVFTPNLPTASRERVPITPNPMSLSTAVDYKGDAKPSKLRRVTLADLAAQARQFYARFFGHDLNDAQIAHILRVPTA